MTLTTVGAAPFQVQVPVHWSAQEAPDDEVLQRREFRSSAAADVLGDEVNSSEHAPFMDRLPDKNVVLFKLPG